MAGIRGRDNREMAGSGFDRVWQSCTIFVLCSQYVLFDVDLAVLNRGARMFREFMFHKGNKSPPAGCLVVTARILAFICDENA
jgi:hypothetical protein